VLVVDDDVSMARALQRVLRRAGYETLTASDGLVARSLVYSFKPSLVMVDLCMPHVDGIALTTVLRELGDKVPSLACKVLVVSGAAQGQAKAALQHLMEDPAIALTTAAQTGHILVFENQVFLPMSPFTTAILDALSEALYGNRPKM